jgi:hypothetical protein
VSLDISLQGEHSPQQRFVKSFSSNRSALANERPLLPMCPDPRNANTLKRRMRSFLTRPTGDPLYPMRWASHRDALTCGNARGPVMSALRLMQMRSDSPAFARFAINWNFYGDPTQAR